ncbi:MAG: hypothetical protein NZ530_07560 [Thermodesulfobacteriaceae bacterium]|nr:hypothetical protein [Thermodesulfobacteriaceae bacterium]MCX8042160.1 hypothetical protein [Thermodesulfobacteriaceae bacterium]MDW8135419.1 hypothetical protein [Thermodesulfobacterium sp.]
MTLELKDLLIDKPVCLIYWELKTPLESVSQYFFQNNFEVKILKDKSELEAWLKLEMVKVVICAGNGLEEVQDLKTLLDTLPIEKRRKIFVIYIFPSENTLDPEKTFLLSANLLISEKDLEFFEKIYSKASLYWEILYRNYYKALESFSEEVLTS